MHHDYADIRERIAEEPSWWDEQGVPRYSTFSPKETANIYADECCLLIVDCQCCEREFHVCISRTRYQTAESARALASFVRGGDLHYGDPPNVGCCAAGPTMNSVPRRVLEFWRRSSSFDWERDAELEIAFEREEEEC